jgi:uncharacterized short protein YbdD (DUF466 family)
MRDERKFGERNLSERIRLFGKCLGQCAQLMVGLPDYEVYVAHVARAHPGQAPMTYEEFFRERQAARYGAGGAGGMRCC